MEKDAKYIIPLTIEKTKRKIISKFRGEQRKMQNMEHMSVTFLELQILPVF